MTDGTLTLSDALLDPNQHYEDPKEVAKDVRFTSQEQVKILKAWLDNEQALQRAANEGLDGGERPHLRSVAVELQRLEDQTTGKPSS